MKLRKAGFINTRMEAQVRGPWLTQPQSPVVCWHSDGARAALEEAENGAISFLPYLLPQWEPLFSNPRFLAVLKRCGLPPPPGR